MLGFLNVSPEELLEKKPDFSKDEDFQVAKHMKSVDFNKFGKEADEARKLTQDINKKKFERRLHSRRYKRSPSHKQLKSDHFGLDDFESDMTISKIAHSSRTGTNSSV